jgi:hypothetical protein
MTKSEAKTWMLSLRETFPHNTELLVNSKKICHVLLYKSVHVFIVKLDITLWAIFDIFILHVSFMNGKGERSIGGSSQRSTLYGSIKLFQLSTNYG